jgi:hypothetical protein
VLVRGQHNDIHTNDPSAPPLLTCEHTKNAHKWSPLKSPKAITLPSPSPRPRDPAGTSALPEKRGGEKGQSAVVGEANKASVMRKKTMERRRGGRKRLLRRERMRMASDSASSGRAGLTMLLSVLTKGALCTLHSRLSCSQSKKLSLQHHTFVMAPHSEDLNPQMNLS